MAAKMATIVGDVTGLQQRHHSLNIRHLVKKIKGFSVKAKSLRNTATYQKLWGGAVADPGEGPGGPVPHLFFDQNEAQRAEKNFFGDRVPLISLVWMTAPPPPTYLKGIWIRH